RMPYLWMSILVGISKHTELMFWQQMLKYDEPMYWQNFEDFNSKFLALRISLFRLIGYSKISLKKLLCGASFSRGFPEVDVNLPESTQLCRLRHRYPREGKLHNFQMRRLRFGKFSERESNMTLDRNEDEL